MAEGIIVPVVAGLLSKLASTSFKEIALICGAKEEFSKLKDTFSAMQAVLLDAEQKADLNHAVKDWLGKLKDAAYDSDDLLDELSYETLRREAISRDKKVKKVRIFFSKHNQLAFASKMAHKIKKLRERLELIAADRTQFHFVETKDREYTHSLKDREYTHSFVREEEVIGRDKEKEEIVERLLEINEKQNVSVDAIVGIGGLGKTTLAQSVFNDKRVEDAFELRLWVCISDIFNLKIIVKKIIEAATKQCPSEIVMDVLQSKLRKEIDGKKYLLVTDDVWNEDGERWAELKRLLMGGAKGSKILITTRSELVAEVSKATSPYILKGLSESNSWILFKQMAFKEGKELERPNMIGIGKEIARKCMGVPLVIRTIGRLLYFKTSEVEWSSFKDNELSRITQQENKITQVLKLSYNHLPSHLKSCFAYFSLFPKDYWFKKDELIRFWMAEGFVQSRGENECLEDVGNEYFMELIWRSIFQDVQINDYGGVKGCKMHDLMHDLAQLVAGTECVTQDSDIKNVNERTRRITFDDCGAKSKWSALFTSQLKSCKLRTFLMQSSEVLAENGLEAHISSLKSLRILSLQKSSIGEIPCSIGVLKHLRFLNLCGNEKIKSLPSSVTKLHFLQSLQLINCPLLELLEDIGNLVNLRHLHLCRNKVIKRLPDSTSKLLHLQELNLRNCSLIELPEKIGNMVNLRFLHLENNGHIELLPNSIGKLQKLQILNLSGCESLRELPREVSNLATLKHLYLEGCVELRGMPLGIDKMTGLQTMSLYAVGPLVSCEYSGLGQLSALINNISGRLSIQGLHHLRKDPSQANTINLKDNHRVRYLNLKWSEIGYNPNGIDHDFLVLEKLHPNKNIEKLRVNGYGGVSLSSWIYSLSNLKEIIIENCERLQNVPRFDRLPNLKHLSLINLNLIEYIDDDETVDEFHPSVFFPSLQLLHLENMDKLKGWWKSREFPPKDHLLNFLLPSFHCLSTLCISGCPQLSSIPSPSSSLKTLELGYSSASPEDDTQGEALDGRDDLHSKGVPKLATLPEGFQHLTYLCVLKLRGCKDLVTLPDWIGNFTSLYELEIIDCPKLTLLPESISQLSSLKRLTISGCSRLEERCTPQIGEDWSKIAHVEDIEIGD